MTEAALIKYSVPIILGLLFWALGFNSGWRVRGDEDEEFIRHAFRAGQRHTGDVSRLSYAKGWRDCEEAVAKEFKIELGVIKKGKEL